MVDLVEFVKLIGFLVVLSGKNQGQNASRADEEEACDGGSFVEGFLGVVDGGVGIFGLRVLMASVRVFVESKKLTSEFSFMEFGAVLNLGLQVCQLVERLRVIIEQFLYLFLVFLNHHVKIKLRI